MLQFMFYLSNICAKYQKVLSLNINYSVLLIQIN